MDVEEAEAYHQTPAIQEMNIEFSSLDTKASALIAHLSLMIAAISILHGSIVQRWLKVVFVLEIVFYICTLIFVIRVIYYSYYVDIMHYFPKERQATSLMMELKKRMIYYRLAHKLTNFGTVALLVSLLLTILF